jgi:hypothetical protein
MASGWYIKSFAPVTTVAASDPFDIASVGRPSAPFTVQLSATGSPVTCAVLVKGSVDGVSYFDIGGGSKDLSSAGALVPVTTNVTHILIDVTALSGGTSPAVVATALFSWA